MTSNIKHIINFKNSIWTFVFICFFTIETYSQVTSSIDSTAIKIGEQITFKVEVLSDTLDVVVFPEGQSFTPLEMIESYKTDTIKEADKYTLIKKYGLTQFDSGAYTIPRQKIVIGSKTFFTDSLKVEVKNILVDTTKQGLYDIKPYIEVEKSASNWWKYLIYIALVSLIIIALLYWFIWRKKPLTEEEKIALLLPYDRAKLALKKLDESKYLEQSELKQYYSELTFIIRKYLDEKVYDHALESTTDELVDRLNLLKDGNQIELSKDDIRNIETILKRADLVKFAKGNPDIALAEIDRNTIDLEIDHVKEALPEPTEEEKLLNEQYKEEQVQKQKRRKVWLTVAIVVGLLIMTFVGFGMKYGFTYVKDSILGHETKELLEGNWVKSEYGVPPISISTPKVLKRTTIEIPEQLRDKVINATFFYNTVLDPLSVSTSTTVYNLTEEEKKQVNTEEQIAKDLVSASEQQIKNFEDAGTKDILVQREKFVTPNLAEGLKTFGTMNSPTPNSDKFTSSNYVLLNFRVDNISQQIVVTWSEADNYAGDIAQRIIDSIELKINNEQSEK